MPVIDGGVLQLSIFDDTSCAENVITWRLNLGFVIFIGRLPIVCP